MSIFYQTTFLSYLISRFLQTEMHVLIFLAVVLFVPPCADSFMGKMIQLIL